MAIWPFWPFHCQTGGNQGKEVFLRRGRGGFVFLYTTFITGPSPPAHSTTVIQRPSGHTHRSKKAKTALMVAKIG